MVSCGVSNLLDPTALNFLSSQVGPLVPDEEQFDEGIVLLPPAGFVAESSLATGRSAGDGGDRFSGTLQINAGGDPLQSVVINGVDVTTGGTVQGDHGVLTVTVVAGIFSVEYILTSNTLDHDGINLTGASDTDTETFDITVTDISGESVNAPLIVTIGDDGPQGSGAVLSVIVFEDALNSGNMENAGQVLTASGSVVGLYDFGADGPGVFSINPDLSGLAALTSGGVPVIYTAIGNSLVATAGGNPVFTLTIDPVMIQQYAGS